jgi:putative tricarboxylic transport membrane protein
MKRYHLGGALFLFAFGGLVCFEARKLEVGKIFKPGPGFFPFWLGAALILVSGMLIIQFAGDRRKESDEFKGLWRNLAWEKILFVLIALLLYAFFLESLGYMISTALLMLFLFRAVEPQRWTVVILGSFITSLFTYVLFKVWLQVQLPTGLLGM